MVNLEFSLEGFEYWLLILVRIASFMNTAPILGQKAVPQRAKVGVSFFVSVILYGVVEQNELEYVSVIGFAVLIINEAITGLLIGFIANICNSIVLFAGTMIDMDIGLSMAQEFNPEMNTQVSITGNVYYYLTMLLLLVSNMHLYVLQAACDSFHLIPVGGVTFVWDDKLAVMTKYMVDLFVIAFRIFLPFFACMLVLNCILGVMAKVAPQMNMFSVGIQLKVLVGLVVLFLTIFLLPTVVQMLFDEVKILVISIVEGIH